MDELMTATLKPARRSAPAWLSSADADRRENVIAQYIGDGEILDLGIVDSRRDVESTESRLTRFATGLHEFIRSRNPNVLGVDIDEEGINRLKERGYDVVCEDVETMNLDRSFDTIVAGEIIEHLPNAGLALRNLRKHLKPDGRLILSTCNPFYSRQHWKIWRNGDVQVHDEHTAWFDPHTLARSLNMAGYEVERLVWLQKRRGLSALKNWASFARRYFSPNFLLVAKHADAPSRNV